MPLIELVSTDIKQAIESFEQFHRRFAGYFATKTRTMAHRAKQYLQGQLQYERWGNMVQFEKIVPESDHQSLQHFASNSPWEDDPILADVYQNVSGRIGDSEHGSIHIDESGLPKQGDDSVGVARQYCGRLGKVDNCQMGVFLGYTANSYRMLLDKRLYLPAKWALDKKRREKCGVPESVEFQTKAQLGLELIRKAQERTIPFAWVGMDSHYGQQEWLLAELEGQELLYIADVPYDTRVWLELPKTEIPRRKGNKGRKTTELKAESQPAQVRQMASGACQVFCVSSQTAVL